MAAVNPSSHALAQWQLNELSGVTGRQVDQRLMALIALCISKR